MPEICLKDKFIELLRSADKAHFLAFQDVNGENPEWPIWYADYLLQPLSQLLDGSFTRSLLVYCLMNAEFERKVMAPDTDWALFLAEHFIEHFQICDNSKENHLALYHTPSCPFCVYVSAAIKRLGLEVELLDIFADSRHYNDLIGVRNRATVPVLRITSPDGESRWLPESRDIVHYLEETYG